MLKRSIYSSDHMSSDNFSDTVFHQVYLAMESIENELDISIASDSDQDDLETLSCPNEEPTREDDIIHDIEKNKRDIRAASIKMRQYKMQREAFHEMVIGEDNLRKQILEYNVKLEDELKQIRDIRMSRAAKQELTGTDAWKLVDNCICGERLLDGIGDEDYGIVGYKCECTCKRILHFKCILSIQESKCPWCRSSMLFGGPLGSRKRMHNEMQGESAIIMSDD